MATVSRFVLVTSFLMHTQIICGQLVWFVFLMSEGASAGCVSSIGIMYLLYPLCGWIADVYLSNFKAIKFSFFAALFSSVMIYLTSLYSLFYPHNHASFVVLFIIAALFGMIGLGLYEANAIQFALNQMVVNSSVHLFTGTFGVPMLPLCLCITFPWHFLNCIIEIENLDHEAMQFPFSLTSIQVWF